MIKIAKLQTLVDLIEKLRTKCLGMDDFTKLISEKRALREKNDGSKEAVSELMKNHNVKMSDNDPRFFDPEVTEDNARAFQAAMKEYEKKEIQTKKFISKKNLLALKHENDLTIDEYELLVDAFEKDVPEEKPKKK